MSSLILPADHIDVFKHLLINFSLYARIECLKCGHFGHSLQRVIVLPIIQNILVKSLNFLSQVILPGLLILLMSLRQDQPCKKGYVIGIDVELALLEKVVDGLGSDLEVLACLL